MVVIEASVGRAPVERVLGAFPRNQAPHLSVASQPEPFEVREYLLSSGKLSFILFRDQVLYEVMSRFPFYL